jgi:hypothetical protein
MTSDRLAILTAAMRASAMSGSGIVFRISFQYSAVTIQRENAGKTTHRFQIPFYTWALHFFSTYEELMKDCPGDEFTAERLLKLYNDEDYDAIAFFYERLAEAYQDAADALMRKLHEKIQQN